MTLRSLAKSRVRINLADGDVLGLSTNAGVVGSARLAWMYHEKVQEVVTQLDERIRHLYVVER